MASRPVSVRILHPAPGPGAGPLQQWVARERGRLAEGQLDAFRAVGADDASIVSGPPDDTPFGARVRRIVRDLAPGDPGRGLVVLGSGSVPLATAADLRAFVEVAAASSRRALANNRYSADIVAIGCATELEDLPDLPSDNALPRWLEEVAGFEVRDLRGRRHLAFDVDGPLELVLLGAPPAAGVDVRALADRFEAVRAVAADRRAEILVAGRISRRTLGWLEGSVPARIRALVEERGLRAASELAMAPGGARPGRPPASVLGMLLDRDGPDALGSVLAGLGDAAVLDTRVLLAHRFGPDERSWPPAEDRFASDLLLAGRVGDPWLRALTRAALDAPIPILLGGHSLVDAGLRVLLGVRRKTRRKAPPWT